jgi:outer membrane biosynthesis protein TonB
MNFLQPGVNTCCIFRKKQELIFKEFSLLISANEEVCRMKKLLIIFGILLLAGLAMACRKQQEEPVAPAAENQLEATETWSADEEIGDQSATEDEALIFEEEQEAEQETAWDTEEKQQEEDYDLPEWDLTEPESPEEPPADAEAVQSEESPDEMVQEEPEADMEETPASGEQTY